MKEDFQNGCLLEELLHKFNHITNLNDFRDENDRSATMNNFARLHDVLNVGVKFDTNITRDIINKKLGVLAN